ncbi:MAG: PilZ domain-containing protein [Polyangiaceae bacterium]
MTDSDSDSGGKHLERRADRRAPLPQPVMVDCAALSQPAPAHDVSRGGLSLKADLGVDVGAVIEVYFELPIGYAVETRAEVIRRQGGITAVKFLALTREDEVALRSYCRISGLHRIPQEELTPT